MIRSRALPTIGAGLLALVCAGAAMIFDQVWLIALGAVLALTSAGIAIDWHRRRLQQRISRSQLTAEAAHLADLNDEAVARAARFEADAIRARAELAEAMQRRRADDGIDLRAGGHDVTDVTAAVDDGKPVTDPETGLFSQLFFDASLVKRISAARRGLRPLSVAVADVVVNVGTPAMTKAPIGPVAAAMQAVFREADTLALADDGLFLVLLEDTPENGAIWTLERLRRRIAEDLPDHTIWVGLSCYPAYGFGADQLVSQARGALSSAREWQQDRIEVTTAAPD